VRPNSDRDIQEVLHWVINSSWFAKKPKERFGRMISIFEQVKRGFICSIMRRVLFQQNTIPFIQLSVFLFLIGWALTLRNHAKKLHSCLGVD
jgi:hypothetical protein